MKHASPWPVRSIAGIAAATLALAAASGAAFASWIDNGAGIFLAMAESGLSWCF